MTQTQSYRVAVDIGGTFTDAVCLSPEGTVRLAKALSIPGRQDSSVLEAVERIGVGLAEVGDFIHGTTTALNALLERSGARLAMVVTRGFRDVYEIGRASRPEMYNIHYHRPPMLLRRRDVFEVAERVGADGEVALPLDEAEVTALAARLAADYEAVAVCFLHAHRFMEHERRAKELISAAAPGLAVVASHEVAPQWREYERFSTTLVSAYVTPKIGDYLSRLETRLAEDGLPVPLHVMQSNGGVMTAQMGVRRAVQTLFSGPVGGTVAGVAIGAQLGVDRLICVDMGGTSFDVSLVVNGAADIDAELEIEGHPVLTPSVIMHSLGAGGGSIIHVESGGLRVGPESAGASPGPACYARGGERPTITDANLLLGRIPEDTRMAGTVALDRAAAERAMARVAAELGLAVTRLAAGAVAVADAAMADAIRELTVARGIDPRGFDLLAFGGAGPLHAVALAEELAIPRVIVPAAPGTLSAWGMLQADVRHDLVRAFFAVAGRVPAGRVAEELRALRAEARGLLAAENVSPAQMVLQSSGDLRYAGQEYTLTVPLPERVNGAALGEVTEAFHAAYQERYGHSNPAEDVEIVNLRVAAIGVRPRPAAPPVEARPRPAPTRWARTVFSGEAHDTAVHDRTDLGAGSRAIGPCIVLETGCTTLVPPGWQATLTEHGHLILERLT
ncbi:5-oxoprolinase [Acrocarpospora pleiomorpha]|uniref:5-oxoprolinase n=1 Tax=Acrocarpospora pleiomorpha TaxID=90975 RepID=A0A5M3Y0N3_9ACTN|nr:hydantoinase/oxoprolinase family protein [Acrocarpospora pleiomorpha]GES25361.1 5-oxoprolinase [Acrocarpospora pleiomorpha]